MGGRKRHIAVDTLGLLLTVVVHSAGLSDSRGARCVLLRLFRYWPALAKVFVDGGYKTGLIDWAQLMFGYVVEVVQRVAGPGFQVLPKRWIIERNLGWLVFQRRFSKD
jgi:transposase